MVGLSHFHATLDNYVENFCYTTVQLAYQLNIAILSHSSHGTGYDGEFYLLQPVSDIH